MTSSIHNTSDSSASAKDDSFALPVRRSTMPIRWNSVTSDNNVDSPPENAVKDTSVAPNDPGAGIPRLSTTGPESPQMSASEFAETTC